MSAKNYDYDIIVIGSGPGGSSVAEQCAQSDLKVAIADYRFGGVCATRGCTPKKALEVVSSLYWKARKLQHFGFPSLQDRPLNWKDLLSQVELFTATVPVSTKKNFRDQGIDTLEAKVAFKDAHTLVDRNGDQAWTAERIVIASGAHPRPLDFPGAELLFPHESFFTLPDLPETIVFAGGGYISFELAHIAAACGSKVVIVSDDEQPLGSFDWDVTQQLIQATLEKNIDLRLGHSVKKIVQEDGRYVTEIERLSDGHITTLRSGCVIHTAGRVPNVTDLDLDRADIQWSEEEGVEINNTLRCEGSEHIFALGDVIGQRPFTSAASYEANTLVYNLQHSRAKRIDYQGLPYVLYTYPKVASVGATEEALRAAGTEYECIHREFTDDLLEKADHNDYATYKVLLDKEEKTILGAHVISTRAEEIINILGIAMQTGMEKEEISSLLMAYPSATQATKYMVD